MIALDLALTSKKSDRETYIDVLSAQKRQAEHSNSKLKEMLQNGNDFPFAWFGLCSRACKSLLQLGNCLYKWHH